jgi:hypothetical protein
MGSREWPLYRPIQRSGVGARRFFLGRPDGAAGRAGSHLCGDSVFHYQEGLTLSSGAIGGTEGRCLTSERIATYRRPSCDGDYDYRHRLLFAFESQVSVLQAVRVETCGFCQLEAGEYFAGPGSITDSGSHVDVVS